MEGSPTGSPQAGSAGGAVDGAELARRMMAATEAASAATQLAAKALDELKTATEKLQKTKIGTSCYPNLLHSTRLRVKLRFLDGETGAGLLNNILVVWIQCLQKRLGLSETTSRR